MNILRVRFVLFISSLSFLFTTTPAKAFSILAHEAIVDAEWDIGIKPLLKAKFPGISGEQFRSAHAYAYGGCLMADMGYMPGGNGKFTDLLHYVRSGNFIMNLLNEARTSDEYAFALGALSHYMADEYGHSLATNKTVPLVYPKLREKFGNTVTYEDDHASHSRIEFTFDVLQVARGNYALNSYHDFIGFQMAVPLLEKVFKLTYGQELSIYFKNINKSINTYRWDIRQVFPRMIKKAAKANKEEISKVSFTKTSHNFSYRMRRHMFNIEFGKEKHTGSFFARLIAEIIHGLPKIGPLKTLKFINPTPQGEKLFDETFATIVQKYGVELNQLTSQSITLPNIDFDTGHLTALGEYSLTDKTYVTMVMALQDNHFKYMTPSLKQNILDYYSKATPASFKDLKPKDKNKLLVALQQIKLAQPFAAVDSTTIPDK